MLYLFLGNTSVGLYILFGIALEDELTNGQYAFVIALSMFLSFLPTLGYLVGRYLSKSDKLHWETLFSLAVIVGVVSEILLPELGFNANQDHSMWYIPTTLFFAIAFISPKIELWRLKSAGNKQVT